MATCVAHYLAVDHPELVCWTDYHLTASWFRMGVELLQSGGSDISIINMRGLCSMAQRGNGLIDRPFPNLRALVTFPHHDWIVFGIDPKFGIRSFADLKAKRPPLNLTTGHLNGDNVVGFMAVELLRRHGIELDDIRSWGGKILDGGFFETREHLDAGRADAVFQEATGHDHWLKIFHRRNLVCLPTEPEVVDSLRRDFGWEPIAVPAGTYSDQTQPLITPDASGWVLCCRDDLDEDLAYSIARVVAEHGAEIANARVVGSPGITIAHRIPGPDSPAMADTHPVPLHPGAARLYREKGWLN